MLLCPQCCADLSKTEHPPIRLAIASPHWRYAVCCQNCNRIWIIHSRPYLDPRLSGWDVVSGDPETVVAHEYKPPWRKNMSLLVEAGALLIAAVTKWIQASGEQITPQQLAAKAEQYAKLNTSELDEDRADDLRHFEGGTPVPLPGDEPG